MGPIKFMLMIIIKKLKYYDIEKYLDKEDIMKYLHFDYYVYNHIKTSPFLWEWQHGKIF